jgi:predicted ribosomally synthesized peptide with nif11-like leader
VAAFPLTGASLEAFCARVAADDDLRTKVHGAAGVDDFVAIAAAHGHNVDQTVLLREQARAISAAPDHALAGINSWADALMHCFGAEKAETELRDQAVAR